MRLPLLALALTLLTNLTAQSNPQWHGFDRQDFELAGTRCTLITPRVPAPGRPWIWRARFFGHEPQTEIALLKRGFHVAYTDVAGLFGNDTALQRWDALYHHLREKHHLHPRPALLGMSRGGLIVFRWAAAHPDQVACIYVDAPVCDISSWPGGKGSGKGSPSDWKRCLTTYGLDEQTVRSWSGNPIDQLQPLATAKIPILSICGAADHVVPFAENTKVIEQKYRELGGPVRVIAKQGVGHHPHSLQDPTPIVNFVVRHTIGSGDYFELRSGLGRSFSRFAKASRSKVAFLGGSITYNSGWREMVAKDLQKRFPNTTFEFVNAGIPSFGSTPGAFRMHRDVFANGKIGQTVVDLLFVEAAVNDSTNGRTTSEMTRGMEGIVRQARLLNPEIDIVMMHFVDPDKMQQLNQGIVPTVIQRHEAVARHYAIPSIDLATEVTERIAAGEFTWKDDFKNLHPSPFGQRLYAATIRRLFDAAKPTGSSQAPTSPPALDPFCYSQGRLTTIDQATDLKGFRINPQWQPSDRAGTRSGFVRVPMLIGTNPGSSLSLPFHGKTIGILVTAGPDAGQIEYSIDGGEFRVLDLFTRWSRGLHLPWSHVLASELKDEPHRLDLRIGTKHHKASRDHAVRIAYFLTNSQ
jgi:sialidase-1